MSSEASTSPRSGRSWREIRQEVTPRAMSRKGRRRRRLEGFKLGVLCIVIFILAGVIFLAVHTLQDGRGALAAVVKGDPIREISVRTDGTLTRPWVEERLALAKDASLMELDLPALRDRLQGAGQVRLAVVTRKFPDTLVVALEERTPVVRVQVQAGAGQPRQLFVAKDGVVYEGNYYDLKMVDTLPWLDGIRLVRAGQGYARIAGLEAVSDLLVTAQLQAPNLYHDWTIVSLARFEERDEIVVRSQGIPEIVFSRREDFFKQIARLDFIADRVRQAPESGPIQSVNLGLGAQVPVRLAAVPDDAKSANPAKSPLPSTSQRKIQRDL